MAIHPIVALYKRLIRLYRPISLSIMGKEPIAVIHTVLAIVGSLLITTGVSLPFWITFTLVQNNACRSRGYSGLWVACAEHCTLKTSKLVRPLDFNITACTNEETCFNFEDSPLAIPANLQLARVMSCVSAFCSFVSVGFAIVRVLRWGLMVKKVFTWVLVGVSGMAGFAGLGVFLVFLYSSVDASDVTRRVVTHMEVASILFLVGSLFYVIDAGFLIVAPFFFETNLTWPERNFGDYGDEDEGSSAETEESSN